MNFPQYVSLHKVETRKDALHPQEEKYPSGNTIAEGFMYEHTVPKIGECFYLYTDKKTPFFRTSTVEVVTLTGDTYAVKTRNSLYHIRPSSNG